MGCSEKNGHALPWRGGACWPGGAMLDGWQEQGAGERPPMVTDRLTDTGCGSPHTRHRGLKT